jgi:hypothetical protein
LIKEVVNDKKCITPKLSARTGAGFSHAMQSSRTTTLTPLITRLKSP